MKRIRIRTVLLILVLIVLILPILNSMEAPLFRTFRFEDQQKVKAIVIMDQGKEVLLTVQENAELVERISRTVFEGRYWRSGRSDDKTYRTVRLSFYQEYPGGMTYVMFASGDLLVDRGYFYRNRKAEESLKDLIALGEQQGVPITVPDQRDPEGKDAEHT